MNRARPPVTLAVDPVLIALADSVKVEAFFGVAPETLVEWNETKGFPIKWHGEGRGRKGFVPVRKARQWAERDSA